MIAPARLAAYDILRSITTGSSDLSEALVASRLHLADDRDRALAAHIASGTLRWQAALDHLITHFSGRGIDRLDLEVLLSLRLSAYQLLHLDRVPASAVVDDGVSLVKRVGKQSAAGLANAVLRQISRHRDHLPWPAPPAAGVDTTTEPGRTAMLDHLSITLSHPRWLAARWLDRYGADAAAAWARFNNQAAPITLRVNTLKTTPEALVQTLSAYGVEVRPAPYAADGLIVVSGNPIQTPLADQGLFTVQDEASQLVATMAGARPGERVLDTCASPGGKATAMAASMQDRGSLVAADRRPRRLELLRQTTRLSGARIIRLLQLDLEQALPLQPVFDCVLLDAPCSGLGTIRRDPEIRWRRAEPDLARFASTQRRFLEHAAQGVAPGGRILYATCSSEPEENEQVVEGFLAGHPVFKRRPGGQSGPPGEAPGRQGVSSVLDERGDLRTRPDLHGLEAFFGALLERRG